MLFDASLAGGKDDRGRYRGIREGTDPGQTTFDGARHRGKSHHTREGENETEGTHLTVSGLLAAGAVRRCCWRLHSHWRFPEFCAKSEKWFHRLENCFVADSLTKQYWRKLNDFKGLTIPPVKLVE
jgi:hypothetical protein